METLSIIDTFLAHEKIFLPITGIIVGLISFFVFDKIAIKRVGSKELIHTFRKHGLEFVDSKKKKESVNPVSKKKMKAKSLPDTP